MVVFPKYIHVTALIVAVSSIVIAYILITGVSLGTLDNDALVQNNYDGNDDIENRYVTDCIPAGPDDITPAIGIRNQTHSFDLRNCVWQENNVVIGTTAYSIDETSKLKVITAENLVQGLIESYDDKGLEGLRNANYVVTLTGNLEGKLYLYIVDPSVGVVGKPNDSVGLDIRIPSIQDGQSLWQRYAFNNATEGSEVTHEMYYFKMHDGLIFLSGYLIE